MPMKKIISFGVNIFTLFFWGISLTTMSIYGILLRSLELNFILIAALFISTLLIIIAFQGIKTILLNEESLAIIRPFSIFRRKSKILFDEKYSHIKSIGIIYGGLTGLAKIEIDLKDGTQKQITSIEFIFYSKKKLLEDFKQKGINSKLFTLGLNKERIEVSV